jgi:hypothetical protein
MNECVFGGKSLPQEVEFAGTPLRQGAPKGMAVRRVQEWLCLHGFAVPTDREFGPATKAAVKNFQQKKGLPVTDVVDRATFLALVAPMRAALKPIPPRGKTMSQLIVAYARQHVAQHPREVGGQNMGPWVRLYMDGNEGDNWLWCAGFATYPISQAAQTLERPMPVLRNFGVANIANAAKTNRNFVRHPATNLAAIKPGSLFLEPGGPNGYLHTGLVVGHNGDSMSTLEGNSNNNGSSNGFEALARTRSVRNMDFALV